MPNFAYTARDESGNPVSGTLAAASVNEVSQILRSQRQYPVSVRPISAAENAREQRSTKGIKISRSDVIQISTQLATMLETGVTLIEALDCVAVQADRNPKLQALVEDLSVQVQGGTDFSAAMSRHPRSFPRLYIALMKASEKSGMLSK